MPTKFLKELDLRRSTNAQMPSCVERKKTADEMVKYNAATLVSEP